MHRAHRKYDPFRSIKIHQKYARDLGHNVILHHGNGGDKYQFIVQTISGESLLAIYVKTPTGYYGFQTAEFQTGPRRGARLNTIISFQHFLAEDS